MSSHYMGILLAWRKDELKLLAYLKSELQKSEYMKIQIQDRFSFFKDRLAPQATKLVLAVD